MDPIPQTILIIDDEEANLLLIGGRLTSQGYAVQTAGGGHEALLMLQAQHFDLVLLDLMMPKMDGLATLDAIRSNPLMDAVPVIMLTASGAREDVVHCLSLGAVDYLVKPINPNELKARVGRRLQR